MHLILWNLPSEFPCQMLASKLLSHFPRYQEVSDMANLHDLPQRSATTTALCDCYRWSLWDAVPMATQYWRLTKLVETKLP